MVKIHKTMEELKVGDCVEVVKTIYYKNMPIGTIALIVEEYGDRAFGISKANDSRIWFFSDDEIKLVSFETQKKQVLAHLQNTPITSWEAINTYRITRLSAVIYELRKTLTITSEWKHSGKKRWTKYTLIK